MTNDIDDFFECSFKERIMLHYKQLLSSQKQYKKEGKMNKPTDSNLETKKNEIKLSLCFLSNKIQSLRERCYHLEKQHRELTRDRSDLEAIKYGLVQSLVALELLDEEEQLKHARLYEASI